MRIVQYGLRKSPSRSGPSSRSTFVQSAIVWLANRPLRAFAALAFAGLLAACSGSAAPTNGVVALGSASPDPSSSAAPSSSGSADAYAAMLAYSQCMRSHGVPKFPDPINNNGQVGMRLQAGPGTGIDPQSSAFKAAEAACKSLMPTPPPGSGNSASAQQAFQQMLAYSQCMRNNGLKDFPDPVNDNGRISMMMKAGPGSDLDPNSPTFKAAQEACQSLQPGGPDGAKGGSLDTSGGSGTSSGGAGQP